MLKLLHEPAVLNAKALSKRFSKVKFAAQGFCVGLSLNTLYFNPVQELLREWVVGFLLQGGCLVVSTYSAITVT